VIYLFLYLDLYFDTYETKFAPLFEYKSLLISILMAAPSERLNLRDTIDKLTNIFVNIKKGELNKMKIELKQNLSNDDNINNIKKKMGQTKITSLEQQDALISRMIR
jgi:hypothetical protein